MGIQFSCRHWAKDTEDIGTPVALKRQDITGDGYTNVVHYGTYCNKCAYDAWANGELLMNDIQAMAWLREEIK